MGTPAIVTGANSAYFGMLLDLLDSVYPWTKGKGIPIYVLDFGLTPAELRRIRQPGLEPVSGYAVGSLPAGLRDHHNFHRAWLPKIRPGHSVYMWIDADVWFQDAGAIEVFLASAQKRGLAIAAELDAAYIELFHPNRSNIHRWITDRTQPFFGEAMARTLIERPLLNSGVLALAAACTLWADWRRHILESAERGARSDQIALNVAIYTSGYEGAFLPAGFNWMCNRRPPAIDWGGMRLIHPLPPHGPLSALHLAGAAKSLRFTAVRPDGRSVEIDCSYRSVLALFGRCRAVFADEPGAGGRAPSGRPS